MKMEVEGEQDQQQNNVLQMMNGNLMYVENNNNGMNTTGGDFEMKPNFGGLDFGGQQENQKINFGDANNPFFN